MDITIVNVFIILVILTIVFSLLRGIVTVALIGLALLFAYYTGILSEVINILIMAYEQLFAGSEESVITNLTLLPYWLFI